MKHFSPLLSLVALTFVACSDSDSNPLPRDIDLTTQSLNSVSVELDWIDNSGDPVTEYRILENGVQVGTTTSDTIVITDLSPDTQHCFLLRAIGPNGSPTHQSNASCAETFPDEFPTVPATLTAMAVSSTQVDLSWDEATDDFGQLTYRVLRDGAFLAYSGSTQFEDVGLTPETTYVYQVVTEDSVGQLSQPTDPVSVTTPMDIFPPSIVTGLVARFDGSDVTLGWDESVDDSGVVAGYRIERDGVSLGSVVGLAFIDPAPMANTQHCYGVFPFDTIGNEALISDEACLHTGWDVVDVPQTEGFGFAAAIDVANGDDLDVLHSDGAALSVGSGKPSLSTWDGAAWTTSEVNLGVDIEPTFGLARNEAGALELAALVRGPELGLVHGLEVGGGWSRTIADDTIGVGVHPAIATGMLGTTHVAHLDVQGGVRASRGEGGVWDNTALTAPGATVVAPTVAVDPDGIPHIIVALMDPTSLAHVWQLGPSLRLEVIGASADPFVAPVLRFAPNGELHVVFRNLSGQMQHGTRAAGPGTGPWSFETISPAGADTMQPTLAVAPDGTLHAAYLDVTESAIVHAVREGGVWNRSILDDAPSTSDRVSLGVGADGQPVVAYRADDRLRIARPR